MDRTRTSLWLFLLLNQLPFSSTYADQNQTANATTDAAYQGGSSASATEASNITNGTGTDCLIDTEMGLIAMGSAGGLIVCLLMATVVLACQVYHIQRRIYAPRTSRSNMDLVSSTAHWGTDQPAVQGVVGPCDADVMLEEVRAEGQMEEDRQADIHVEREDTEVGHEEGAMAMAFDPEEKASQLQSSSSRDSCLETSRDIENMPLVV